MFSCEFCEIYKKTFFTEHLWATASVFSNVHWSGKNQWECTFGHLWGRWFFLVIYTCFVFHKSFSNNQPDEAEVQAQIVRHQQEIKKPDTIYLREDASEEYVCRVLTEYTVQNLPDGYWKNATGLYFWGWGIANFPRTQGEILQNLPEPIKKKKKKLPRNVLRIKIIVNKNFF